MNTRDSLGFGTQVSLDGAKADVRALEDVSLCCRVIAELVAMVETEKPRIAPEDVMVLERGEDGHSAALVLGETSVSLHSFPALRGVTLQFFSVRDLPLDRISKLFLGSYGVGRFQSSVRGRGLLLPSDPSLLERALAGERDYVWLRVVPAERVKL